MENLTALTGIDFSPEINLARYLQDIRKYPILTQEEEYKLAMKYKETGNKDVAYQLITSHLRLAVKIALTYRRYGLPTADLISEANIGLMQAVKSLIQTKMCGFQRMRFYG